MTTSNLPSRRLINLLGFTACAGLLGFGYFLQFYEELEPCPLCIFQRVAILFTGIWFLIAAAHNPASRGGSIFHALVLPVLALSGAAVSARHTWLQSLPPGQMPACGPGLEYMLEAFPFFDTIKTVLRGSGDCGEIVWSFLGLSIPQWTLISFVVLALVGLFNNLRREV